MNEVVTRRVETSLSIGNAGQYVQQAQAVSQAQQGMVNTGLQLVTSQEKVTARTTQGATALERVQRQVDKVYAAEQARARQLGILDRALADGNVTQARHLQLVEKVDAAHAKAQGQLARTSTAADHVGRTFSRVNGILGAFGAGLSLYGLVSIGRQALQLGDDLQAMSDQFGISVENIQAFNFAAREGDISTQAAQTALQRYTQTLGDAANGAEDAQAKFDALGVRITDANGKTRASADVLVDVAKRMMMIEDPAERAGAAVDFFGKSGARLGPMLAEIAGGFDLLGERAGAAGEVMSTETVAALASASREIESLGIKITIAVGTALGWMNRMRDELDSTTQKVADAILQPEGSGGAGYVGDLIRTAQSDADMRDRADFDGPESVSYNLPPKKPGGGQSAAEKFQTKLDALTKTLDPQGSAAKEYAANVELLSEAYDKGSISLATYADLTARLEESFAEKSGGPRRAVDKAEQTIADLEAETKALLAGGTALDTFNKSKSRADAVASFEEQLRRETKGLEDQETVVGRLVARYGFLYDAKDAAAKKADDVTAAEERATAMATQAVDSMLDLFGTIVDGSFTAENALNSVLQMLLQIAESAAFGEQGFSGWAGKAISGLFTVGSAVAGSYGAGGGPRGYAQGGAFGSNGPVTAFARGDVVSQPTLFKFASGAAMRDGLMGEAGPEAIVPLKRTSSGDLGVQMTGGRGGGGTYIGVVNVNVESNGQDQPEDQGKRAGQAFKEAIRAEVKTVMVDESRSGGMLKPGLF